MTTEIIEIEEPTGMRKSQSTDLRRSGDRIGDQRLHGSMLDLRELEREAISTMPTSSSFGNSLTLPKINIGGGNIKRKNIPKLKIGGVSASLRGKSLLDTPDTPATPQSPTTPRLDIKSEMTEDFTEGGSQYYDPETEFDEITDRYIVDEEADAMLADQQEMAAELMFEEKEDITSQQKRLAQEFLRDEYHFEQEKVHLKEYMKWRKRRAKKAVDNFMSRLRDIILNYNQYWFDMFMTLILYGQTLALLWILPLRYPELFLKYSWGVKVFIFDMISYRPEIGYYMSYPVNEWFGYDYIWFPFFMIPALILPPILLFVWYVSPRWGGLCCVLCCNEKCCGSICGCLCYSCHKKCESCCVDKEGGRVGKKLGVGLANLFDVQWKYVVEKIVFYVLIIMYTPILVTLLYHGFCLTKGNCLGNCWPVCERPDRFWCLGQSLPAIVVGGLYAILQPIMFFRELRRLNVHKINRKHLQYLRNMEVEKGMRISNDYVYQRLHISSSFSRLGGFFYYIVKYQLRPLLLIVGAMLMPKMNEDQSESNQFWEMMFAIYAFVIFTLCLIVEVLLRPYRLSTRYIVEVLSGITIIVSVVCCWMKSLDLQNAFLVDNSLFVMMNVIHVVAILFILFMLLIFLCFRIGKWPINTSVVKNLKDRYCHYLKAVEDGKLLYLHAISTTPSFVRCDLLFHQRMLLQKYHKEAILMDNPLSNTLENVILQLESEYYANESMSLMPQRKLQEKIGELRSSLDKRMEEMVLIPQRNRILLLKIMAYNAFRKMAGRESLISDFNETKRIKDMENQTGKSVVDNLFKIVVTQDGEEEEEQEDPEADTEIKIEVDGDGLEEEEEGEGEVDFDEELRGEEDGYEENNEEIGEDDDEGSNEDDEAELKSEDEDDGLLNFDNYSDKRNEDYDEDDEEETDDGGGSTLLTVTIPENKDFELFKVED